MESKKFAIFIFGLGIIFIHIRAVFLLDERNFKSGVGLSIVGYFFDILLYKVIKLDNEGKVWKLVRILSAGILLR